MAEPRRIGNRRIFGLPFHRLTKRAYTQLFDTLLESVAGQSVALFGTDPHKRYPGGVLSDWTFQMEVTPTGAYVAFPKPGELGWVRQDGFGGVVYYDPATPGQVSKLPVSGMVGATTSVYIMWRKASVDADRRSETQWVIPHGEVSTPTETINYEVVEFTMTTDWRNSPDAPFGDGWRVLGRLTSGAEPADFRMEFVPLLDSYLLSEGRWGDLPAVTWPMGAQQPQVVTPQDGLLYMLKRMTDLCYMLSWQDVRIDDTGAVVDESAGIVPWYYRPTYGLLNIDFALGGLIRLLRDLRRMPRIYAMVVVAPKFIAPSSIWVLQPSYVGWVGLGAGTASVVSDASGYVTPPSISGFTTSVKLTTANRIPNVFVMANFHGADGLIEPLAVSLPIVSTSVPGSQSQDDAGFTIEVTVTTKTSLLNGSGVLSLFYFGVDNASS